MFATTVKHVSRMAVFGMLILALLLTQAGGAYALDTNRQPDVQLNSYAIVFVSRQIPANGSMHMAPYETGSMPGAGP